MNSDHIFNYVDSKVPEISDFFRDKNILITGSTGFIGGHLTKALIKFSKKYLFNLNIYLTLRSKKSLDKSFIKNIVSNKSINLIIVNLAEKESLLKLKNFDKKFDYIIHAASPSNPKSYSQEKVSTLFINSFTIDILLNFLKQNFESRFLYFSTSGIYGLQNDEAYPIKENSSCNLNHLDEKNIYLTSKIFGESTLKFLCKEKNISSCILRPSINYGPFLDLEDGRAMSEFIKSAILKNTIIVKSSGKALRNYCYIADTLTGIFIALIRGSRNGIYNLAIDKDTSILDLASIIAELTNSKVKIQNQDDSHLGLDFKRTSMDCSKLKSLGWETKYNLREGINLTLDYCKNKLS